MYGFFLTALIDNVSEIRINANRSRKRITRIDIPIGVDLFHQLGNGIHTIRVMQRGKVHE